MAQDWFDDINDAVFPVLLEQQAKENCEYSEDLAAYSADGKRCVHIHDTNTGCEYKYVLIGSKKINDQWSKGEVLKFDGMDGIDVMCTVDAYLRQP
jgi:hypothetical protein